MADDISTKPIIDTGSSKPPGFTKRIVNNLASKDSNGSIRQAVVGAINPAAGAAYGNVIANRQAAKESKAKAKADEEERKYFADLRKGPKDSSSQTRWPLFLAILAIAAHLAMTWPTTPIWSIVIVSYGLILITGFWTGNKHIDSDEIGMLGTMSASIAVIILFSQYKSTLPQQYIQVIMSTLLLFPIVLIYILLKTPKHTPTHTLAAGYISFWAVWGIIFMVTLGPFSQINSTSKAAIGNPTQLMKFVIEGLGNTFSKFTSGIGKSINMAIAQATGQQYDGNEESVRGIILSNARPVEQTYYTDSDVWVEADVTAQNIKEELPIRNNCYIIDGNRQGKALPATMSLINDDTNIIQCELGKLPEGTYRVMMVSTFDFQTDAEIQYYFVDASTKPDLYKNANIPQSTTAIYTGGPVQLGIKSLSQPLRVSMDPATQSTYPFGVSLTNKWDAGGKIVRGLDFTLEVPYFIELTGCTRNYSAPHKNSDGNRWIYYFSIDQNNVRETFDSVTCRMQVSRAIITPPDIYVEKTFNAKATYTYAVEQEVSVTVQNDGAK